MSLLGDEWALVRAGRDNVSDYLTLAPAFAREHSNGVLAALTGRLDFMHEYLADAGVRPKLEGFTRSLLAPLLEEIGFAPKPADPDDRREQRATLIRALGNTAEDADVVAKSRAMLDRALGGASALDPTVADAVVAVAAAHGDAALYDAVAAATKRATSPEESGGDVNLVNSLGAFCDPSTRDDIKAFFTEHKLPTASRTLDQTLERINNCIALRAAQAPVLTKHFSH